MERPISVSVIALLYILGGASDCFSLLFSLFEETFSLSFDQILRLYLINFVLGVLIFLTGIKLLEGQNSGRILFIISALLYIVWSWISYGLDSTLFIGSVVRLIVFGLILYRPSVNKYFTQTSKVSE
ncbi:hypothetical protein QP437_09255 [Haemophilus sp. UMB1048]|uniref:hypothetical protein n=1 Tax=Haemophilus sp. UMB1048 TaxID=3046322 RepID=UPI00255398E4|nr:hypothetical protein [Haemophilus sp. UMB1048]MDK7255051.1 hypothetical protein [Haemophilus sp. UMB1048]